MSVFMFVSLGGLSFCVCGKGREMKNSLKMNFLISALLKANMSKEIIKKAGFAALK